MKKFFHLGIVLAFLLALVPAGASAEPDSFTLYAGQNIKVGYVDVSNDADFLYVEYKVTEPGWCIMETHVHVFLDNTNFIDVPHNNGGPIPGHFDYKKDHECVSEYTHTIPLEWSAGVELSIAAHATVVKEVEDCYETVWQIGEVEEHTCDGDLLTNYADEFNWVEWDGEKWLPLSDPCVAGPSLAVYEPPFTSPFLEGITPVDEFPYNANKSRIYGTDIDVVWDGELLFGGMLTVSWSPGKSASEKKIVSNGDGLYAEFTATGTSQSGKGWFLDTYPLVEHSAVVGPLGAGTHTINFEHTQGDGTFWDWIRLEKPCEQWETAWGGTMDFPGKNWATYFTYTVQCTNVPDVVNGDFEAPVVTASQGWDIYGSGTAGLGWAVEWAGAYSGAPSPAYLELHRGVNGWTSYDGSQHAELDTDWQGPGSAGGEKASVRISQDLQTCAGFDYKVEFAYSPRPEHADNVLKVYWDGSLKGTYSADGSSYTDTLWIEVTLILIASGSTTELAFVEAGTPDSLGMFLDGVSVTLCNGSCP